MRSIQRGKTLIWDITERAAFMLPIVTKIFSYTFRSEQSARNIYSSCTSNSCFKAGGKFILNHNEIENVWKLNFMLLSIAVPINMLLRLCPCCRFCFPKSVPKINVVEIAISVSSWKCLASRWIRYIYIYIYIYRYWFN